MRSTTSSHRRLRSRPPRHGLTEATARIVDETTLEHPGHVLIHVVEEPRDIVLGLRSLDVGIHPFGELAGFTAPAEWSMFGMRVRGTAHHLDDARPAEPTSTTYLLHRSGEECSLLRTGASVTHLGGPAAGTLPDLCRRVLGLATAPAPPTSALLWTVAWLDQILESWGDPNRRHLCSSWVHLASLHPAIHCAPALDLTNLDDPSRLITLGRAHTAAWPWARLRAAPGALHLPDGDLPPQVSRWMDDGFYARWALGAFPPPAALARDVSDLIDPPLSGRLISTLDGLLA